MDREKNIEFQQELLSIYRLSLQWYQRQHVIFGTIYTPPHIIHGMVEARRQIKRIKETLRIWDVQIENRPEDEEALSIDEALLAQTAAQEPANIKPGIFGDYEGSSYAIIASRKTKKFRREDQKHPAHTESFTISRTGSQIVISGSSVSLPKKKRVSFWSGAVWRVQNPSTYYFGLELNHKGKFEYGNLIITVHDSGVDGHYYSCALSTQSITRLIATKRHS